jgi:hypothetical protein
VRVLLTPTSAIDDVFLSVAGPVRTQIIGAIRAALSRKNKDAPPASRAAVLAARACLRLLPTALWHIPPGTVGDSVSLLAELALDRNNSLTPGALAAVLADASPDGNTPALRPAALLKLSWTDSHILMGTKLPATKPPYSAQPLAVVTPLMCAVRRGNRNAFLPLLRAGASVRALKGLQVPDNLSGALKAATWTEVPGRVYTLHGDGGPGVVTHTKIESVGNNTLVARHNDFAATDSCSDAPTVLHLAACVNTRLTLHTLLCAVREHCKLGGTIHNFI